MLRMGDPGGGGPKPPQTIGRAATAHGQRPCWEWVRRGSPPPAKGILGKFFGFHFAAEDSWCYKTENVFLLNNFDVSKNQIACSYYTEELTFDESVNRPNTK